MACFLELHSLKYFDLNQVHSGINIFGHSSQIIALVKIVDVFGVHIFRGKQQNLAWLRSSAPKLLRGMMLT